MVSLFIHFMETELEVLSILTSVHKQGSAILTCPQQGFLNFLLSILLGTLYTPVHNLALSYTFWR
jgi:hypothetical protein